jgi:hypothetical protein
MKRYTPPEQHYTGQILWLSCYITPENQDCNSPHMIPCEVLNVKEKIIEIKLIAGDDSCFWVGKECLYEKHEK